MILKKCLKCNKVFSVFRCREESAKYCSTQCYIKDWKKYNYGVKIKKGQHLSPATEFKKGMKAERGEKNFNWKGESVGYSGLHRWIVRNKGKASKCFHCNSVKDVQWANLSYKYKRDLNDYRGLCRKCHAKMDFYSGFWGVGKLRKGNQAFAPSSSVKDVKSVVIPADYL